MSTPNVIIDSYDAVLFDLDGVIYLGPVAVPGAAEGIARSMIAASRSASSPTTPPVRRSQSLITWSSLAFRRPRRMSLRPPKPLRIC